MKGELEDPFLPSHRTTMTSSARTPSQPLKLTPLTSLELRIRQLEFLVSGVVSSDVQRDGRRDLSAAGSTNIVRRVLEVQNELERAVEGKSSLERFLDTCKFTFSLLVGHSSAEREVKN